jgi:hypothetical protein
MEERLRAVGHEHVTATHASTFEVTADDFLTPAGDCILAIEADRTPADFASDFVEACRDPTATIEATVHVDGETATVSGRGHPALTFASERGAVGRTSDHVDDRTVLVGADAAAADLPRPLVKSLAAGAPLELRLRVVA